MSVGSQLVTNQGDNEGLFRSAIMQSGSPQNAMDSSSCQWHYDRLVSDLGCSGADDTLDCLRDLPYEKLKQGVEDMSPGMFGYQVGGLRQLLVMVTIDYPTQGISVGTWPIAVDDDFLLGTPISLVQAGTVAPVPVIIGKRSRRERRTHNMFNF